MILALRSGTRRARTFALTKLAVVIPVKSRPDIKHIPTHLGLPLLDFLDHSGSLNLPPGQRWAPAQSLMQPWMKRV